MATGVRRLVTENYGLRSEKLAEFGIQPFRGRKSRNAVPELGASRSVGVPAVPTPPDG